MTLSILVSALGGGVCKRFRRPMYGIGPGGPEHMFWIDGKAYPQDRTVRKGGISMADNPRT